MQGRIHTHSAFCSSARRRVERTELDLEGRRSGSVETIVGALKQIPQTEVQIRLLLAAPGEITETDIDLAAASDAVIIGFNLASGARIAADAAGVMCANTTSSTNCWKTFKPR